MMINWPVVYILENSKEAYVGETISAVQRMKEHLVNKDRSVFNTFYLIRDDRFNKSATLDIESQLIEYISADGKYVLQNSNKGLRNHNYYDKEQYTNLFKEIWNELKELKVVKNSLNTIRNSDLFKYSPFKALTIDQISVAESLIATISSKKRSVSVVKGEPGSGKTILAVYLCKYLIHEEKKNQSDIALVLPQTSIRETIKKVFKHIKHLKANMVISPNHVAEREGLYDVLIVDESHRLAQRRKIISYKSFDETSKKLGMDPKNATQLDWIMRKAKHVIILYDEKQRVKPADLDTIDFARITKGADEYQLLSQLRVLAGNRYAGYIDSMFRGLQKSREYFDKYEFYLFNDFGKMKQRIENMEKEYGLSRIVAGYAWDWKTKDNPTGYDIEIQGHRLRWNSITKDWIFSENSPREVGCIHTVQGYDLNYCGVIIGPELVYRDGEVRFIREKYKDTHGNSTSLSDTEMLTYIINIYKTLMTRGIKGTFVFACDEALYEYLSRYIEKTNSVFIEDIN